MPFGIGKRVVCPSCRKEVKKKASCSECGADLTNAKPVGQQAAAVASPSPTPSAATPALVVGQPAGNFTKRLTIAVARAGTKDNPVEAWAEGHEAHKWTFEFDGVRFVVPIGAPWPFATREFAEISLGAYDCADDPNWAPTVPLAGLMLFWGQRISHRLFKVVAENSAIAIADMGRSVQPIVGRLDTAGKMSAMEVPAGGSLVLENGDKVLVGGQTNGIDMELVFRIKIEDATTPAIP